MVQSSMNLPLPPPPSKSNFSFFRRTNHKNDKNEEAEILDSKFCCAATPRSWT
jgi:hypothetical protein